MPSRSPCIDVRAAGLIGAAALLVTILGCRAESSGSAPATTDTAARGAPAAAQPAPPGPDSLPQLAAAGEVLFRERGCAGCHVIGGEPMAAPDLQGVTERRTYGWIVGMILRPDSMTANDEAARQLLARHLTQMPNLVTSEADARALYAYLHAAGQQ